MAAPPGLGVFFLILILLLPLRAEEPAAEPADTRDAAQAPVRSAPAPVTDGGCAAGRRRRCPAEGSSAGGLTRAFALWPPLRIAASRDWYTRRLLPRISGALCSAARAPLGGSSRCGRGRSEPPRRALSSPGHADGGRDITYRESHSAEGRRAGSPAHPALLWAQRAAPTWPSSPECPGCPWGAPPHLELAACFAPRLGSSADTLS